MKVAFYLADQNPHRDRTRGVTVYSEGLLRALLARQELEISTLVSRSSYSLNVTQISQHRLPFRTDRTVGRLVADQLHPLLFRNAADLWHYPKGHLPLRLRYRQPVLGTCHDVILQFYADRYPRMRSASQYAYWLKVLRGSLARFDAVFTVSEFSKTQILQFCERHRIRAPKIVVTVEGTDWENAPQTPVPKDDYVLHLGSVEPHKGTCRLLAYWQRLAASDRELPRLIIVGAISPDEQRAVAAIQGAEHLPPQSHAQLLELLQRAKALILPSEIEGFGLPAIEAFASRTPVVFVQNSAVAEILGTETAGAFELEDFDSFQRGVTAALELTAVQIQEIRDRLAEKYTWRACAETTASTYSEFAGC